MIEAVIFDLDGVIVTTDNFHYLAWKKIADKENIYFDELINNRLRGVSRRESLEIILERAHKEYSEEEKLALMEEKNNYYLNFLTTLNKDDILPNVLEVINSLKAKNIKIAIGSSSRNAKFILNQIGLLNTFDAISDGNDITKSKPDPEVFLVAAKKLNVSPANCIVIEDAISGIEAAKNAGMLAVGIGDATNSDLCDVKINNIIEILDNI